MKSAETYGFVGWIGSFIFYGVYVLWAFIPDTLLNRIGIYYYPDKTWALAFPSFFVVTFIFFQLLYQGLNMYHTKPLHSLNSLQDQHSRFLLDLKHESNDGLPEIYDIPVNVVNNVLYYPGVKNIKRNVSETFFEENESEFPSITSIKKNVFVRAF